MCQTTWALSSRSAGARVAGEQEARTRSATTPAPDHQTRLRASDGAQVLKKIRTPPLRASALADPCALQRSDRRGRDGVDVACARAAARALPPDVVVTALPPREIAPIRHDDRDPARPEARLPSTALRRLR